MSQPQNLFSLSYQGVRAPHPPNVIVKNFDPSPTTAQNVAIGDFWITFNPFVTPQVTKLWVLLGLSQGVATWVEIIASAGDVLTLTGNSGGAINPVAGNINIVTSGSTVTFVGSGNSLTENFAITNLILGSSPTPAPTGARNVGLGQGSLANLTSGNDNIGIGFGSLTALTTGSRNSALGSLSLSALVTGDDNTALGDDALTLATGSANTAVGSGALANLTFNGGNTAVGFQALTLATGLSNTAVGAGALAGNTTGRNNTAVGLSSLLNITTGFNNIAIGLQSGISLATSDSLNINIGNSGTGGDNSTIRIGTAGTHTATYVSGIYNTSIGTTNSPVFVDSTGKLGSAVGGAPVVFQNEVDIVNSTASNTSPADLNLIKNELGFAINSGDQIGCVNFIGFDSILTPVTAGSICVINPVGSTIGANRVAGEMQFSTHPDSNSGGANATLRMRLLPTGNFQIKQADNDPFTSVGTATFQVLGNSITSQDDTNAVSIGPKTEMIRTRNNGIITSGDTLGNIIFGGSDGVNIVGGAQISAITAGTIGVNRVPAALVFYTHKDSATGLTPEARLQIDQNGVSTFTLPDIASPCVQVEGSVSVGGDPGVGTVNATDFTSSTAAAGGGAGAIALQAGGVGVAQAGWLKIYVNNVVSYIPYYQ